VLIDKNIQRLINFPYRLAKR